MRVRVESGLEVLLRSPSDLVRDCRVGIIANPSSVDSSFRHAVDLLFAHPGFRLTAVFGPQHGARGETQDNMIEWSGYRDTRTGLPVYSLYGDSRKPTPEMLEEVDVLLFDVQDVGARYYTFVYTMALAMQACRELGKRFVVLDRPNPIGGLAVEGPVLDPRFASFVGLYPIPVRHGMTVGELAGLFNAEFDIGCDLEVVPMEGWERSMYFDGTGLPWVLPSPNMPALDTALVYPGMCLFEGTNVSEGRGTTRPFEFSGAPWIEPETLAGAAESLKLPGVRFRPVHFVPTFHKWAGERIGGVQIHVTEREVFRPFETGLALLEAYRNFGGDRFAWKEPPYEYEYEKWPFDILCGTDVLRKQLESGMSSSEISGQFRRELEAFRRLRGRHLLY